MLISGSGQAISYLPELRFHRIVIFIDRRADSKSLAWSSIRMAFDNSLNLQGKIIIRPKMLGDIRGVSYIYPMLYRFGIIEVPTEIADRMRGKNPRMKR